MYVAPRVGAWIETMSVPDCFALYKVAPRVGAWIETRSAFSASALAIVAPRVGAWIETLNRPLKVSVILWSHPAWVRGLKQEQYKTVTTDAASHPAWVRGLKPCSRHTSQNGARVAPRVGAWIETLENSQKRIAPLMSRTPRGCVD